MQEEKPVVRNKGLMITAAVIGIIVVIVYNITIDKAKRASRGKTVTVLKFTRNIVAGEKIRPSDLTTQTIQQITHEGLAEVITIDSDEDRSSYDGWELSTDVQSGHFLLWSHISQDDSERPSQQIRPRTESFTLSIDSRTAPGEILSPGDRITVIGTLSVNGKPATAYRIIEGVRVLGIGGTAPTSRQMGGKRRKSKQRLRTYRTLNIEVTPETSLQLVNVLTHLTGPPRVVVLCPNDYVTSTEAPRIATELRKLSARTGRRQ